MRRNTRLLINTTLGIATSTFIVLSICYFLGKLDIEYLKESLASFLPAIFIGISILSVLVIVLKIVSGIIRFLHKKV